MSERKYRNESEWQELIERQEQSGLSQEAFCKSEGVSTSGFHKWKRRLKSNTAASFVPVSIEKQESAKLELELPGGIILRVKQ